MIYTLMSRKNTLIITIFGFVVMLVLVANNRADSNGNITYESNEITKDSILNNKNSKFDIVNELPSINADNGSTPDILAEPRDIAIVTTTSVASVAIVGAISLSSLLKNLGKEFSEELTETAEVTAKIKENIQDQLKELITGITDGVETVENCPKCQTLGIGAYCYLCGTTINYEKAHLLEEQNSE